MAHRKVTVIFTAQTGHPKDNIVNTWHFTTPTASGEVDTQAVFDALVAAVKDFYDTAVVFGSVGGGGVPVRSFVTSVALQPTVTVKIYRCETEIALGLSAEPLFTTTFTLGAMASGAPYPAEVAICASFKSTPTDPAYPAACQRGRVFVGGLDSAQAGGVASGRVYVGAGFRDVLCGAMKRLANVNAQGINWIVWSHKLHQAFPVTAGWVDDAFDTQRRRGPDAGSRTLWTA